MGILFPEKLVGYLRNSRHVVVLTGAGFSAESGVPTFREAQTGLWAKYKAEELATPQAFRRNPEMVWDWYNWRRKLISNANPNSGHYALAKIEQWLCESGQTFTLLTQNVDNLHQRAGSQKPIELHGNIFRTKCFECGEIADNPPTQGPLPRCTQCNGLLRPDVVWFGENLSLKVLNSAFHAARNCALFFSIGTSSVVHPAASLPALALDNDAVLVEINPCPTPLTHLADYVFQAASGEVLPALVDTVWPPTK